MAGSYRHVVDADTGALLDGEGINAMLECHSGDVVECVEEMYGMIWALADRVVGEIALRSPAALDDVAQARLRAEVVEGARLSYEHGLEVSPGTGAELPADDDEPDPEPEPEGDGEGDDEGDGEGGDDDDE